MSCDCELPEDFKGIGCQPQVISAQPAFFNFEAEEKKAVVEERYEDAAKLRDRIVPYISYDLKTGAYTYTFKEPQGYYL